MIGKLAILFSSALRIIKQPFVKCRTFFKTKIDEAIKVFIDETYQIGKRYYRSRDYNRAYQQFLKAAKKGHAEAIKWWGKASENGDSNARYNIGIRYYEGEGVSKDYVEAYKWFLLADADNKDVVEIKKEIAPQMTPEQITEAEKRAK